MREVFAPAELPAALSERVFYTIRPQDKGKTALRTTAGAVDVSVCMGRILPSDAGKRVYFIVGGDAYDVQIESTKQYTARVKREAAVS